MKRLQYWLLLCSLLFFIGGVQAQKIANILQPVNFSDVYVGGELQQRGMKNFDRLEDDIYYPENVFPLVPHPTSAGWPGDKEGRTILALVLDAQAMHRTPKYLLQMIDMIPSKVNTQGYLGPIMKDSIMEQQLSGHGWFLRALCEYYLWKKDPKVKKYILTIVQNLAYPTMGYHKLYPINSDGRVQNAGGMAGSTQNTVGKWMLSSDIGCDFIFMDGVIQSYELFPSTKTKELVEEMITRFLQMDLEKIQAQTHATLTALRGILRYYNITKQAYLLKEVQKRYDLYRQIGMTENYENFNWFDRPLWTEPCAIVDSYMVAMQLWQYTQNPSYLEDAQHIYYNAICHTQRANGGFGCDNCPGPVENDLKVHAEEAFWCCTMRGGEGLSRAVSYSYFVSPGNVYITSYNTGKVVIRQKKGQFTMEQKTQYPFDGQVELSVLDADLKAPIHLKLFALSWMRNYKVQINNTPVHYSLSNGFIDIKYIPKVGDKINLSFELISQIEPMINKKYNRLDYCTLRYGPLILGSEDASPLLINQNDRITKKSTEEFSIEGKSVVLSPVYHLLNPRVTQPGYKKQILFKISQ